MPSRRFSGWELPCGPPATTNEGTLIGVYDARRGSSRDLPGDIDVGMSRSTDGGRTWRRLGKGRVINLVWSRPIGIFLIRHGKRHWIPQFVAALREMKTAGRKRNGLRHSSASQVAGFSRSLSRMIISPRSTSSRVASSPATLGHVGSGRCRCSCASGLV